MPKIEGVKEVIKALNELAREREKEFDDKVGPNTVSVQTGYTQHYALKVHETFGHTHKTGGPKYLESPARYLRLELRRIVTGVFKRTKDMTKALVIAGLRLQRESQTLVPVDTSALRASAYTALEKDVEKVSQAAFSKSQAILKAAGR